MRHDLYQDDRSNFGNITDSDISQIIKVANNEITIALGASETHEALPNSRFYNLDKDVSVFIQLFIPYFLQNKV